MFTLIENQNYRDKYIGLSKIIYFNEHLLQNQWITRNVKHIFFQLNKLFAVNIFCSTNNQIV